MASRNFIKDTIQVLGRSLAYEISRPAIKQLDVNHFTRPEDFFLKADQKRRKKLATTKFNITSKSIEDLPSAISTAERHADELVWLKDTVYTDSAFKVFLGHDLIELAKARGESSITVCRFTSNINGDERMAIILRKASKSNDFPNMARIEAIRESVDGLGWEFKRIRDLMVVRGRHKLSTTDIINEYRTAKIYEEFCSYTTQFGHSLSDHPETFSKLKFLSGVGEIREAMSTSREVREYFVHMVIGTTLTGEERFQDNVPRILKHPRPKKIFLEEMGGYRKALAELKALHPEADRQTFPHYHYVAGHQRLENPDNQVIMSSQIEKNPEGNPTLNTIASSVSIIAGLAPAAFNKFARVLADLDPKKLVQFVVQKYPEEVHAELNAYRSRVRRIK